MNVDEIQLQLLASQPDLTVTSILEGFSINGTYRLSDEYGILDEFCLEIFIPKTFPLSWPVVKEIRGRIPLTEARHINKDGTICYLTHEDYFLWCNRKHQNIETFLDGPLRSYFISQIVFEQNSEWPFGHRLHGDDGRLDFYCEAFGTEDPTDLPTLLQDLKMRKYRGHLFCTCKSGKKLRACHPRILEIQKLFSDELLDKAISHLDNIQRLAWRRVETERVVQRVIKIAKGPIETVENRVLFEKCPLAKPQNPLSILEASHP